MDEAPATDLGHTPRSLRALRGLTQRELADAAGISLPTVAAVEAGGESVELKTLERVAVGLGVEPEVLLAACRRERARAAGSAA